MTLIPADTPYGAIEAVYDYWTAGKAFLPSGLIRRLDSIEVGGVKHKAKINHVGRRFVFQSGISICAESHVGAGVQLTPYEHILKAIERGKVTRYHEVKLDMGTAAMALLWDNHVALHGAGYDKRLIVAYYAWMRLFRRKRKIRAMMSKADNGKYTCNELFVAAGRGLDPHVPHDADVTWTPEYCFYKADGMPADVALAKNHFTYAKDYGGIEYAPNGG